MTVLAGAHSDKICSSADAHQTIRFRINLHRNAAEIAPLVVAQLRYNQRGDLGSIAVQIDAESDRLVGISAGADLVGVRTSKDRHGRLNPDGITISKPGDKLMETTSLQSGETIVEVINAIQPNP